MKFENINEAQLSLLNEILNKGDTIQTRGRNTLEISPAIFTISNPLDRITTIKHRKWNFSAAVGELIWHLSGSNDVNFIGNYLKGWENYSDDGRLITGSCYGHKLFQKNANGESKWDKLIHLLKEDPGSRRAVIDLYDNDTGLSLKPADVSCTCMLQFLIRDKKVNLIVYMRSNDIIWGLPYDFFLFSFLQELLAVTLNLHIGTYTHVAGSLHLYESHFQLAGKILEASTYEHVKMNQIEDIASMSVFIDCEKQLREKNISLKSILECDSGKYWKDLLIILLYHQQKKNGVKNEDLATLKSQSPYATLL